MKLQPDNPSLSAVQNTFIYLVGFPGAGKLTIARSLMKLIPTILVDNHYVNNVIFSLIDTDGKTKLPQTVWKNVARVRDAVFDTIAYLSKPNRNFVFTNALFDSNENDHRLFDRVVELSRQRAAQLFIFRILVDAEEICRRIVSPDRQSNLKDIDAESARKRSVAETVLVPRFTTYFDVQATELSADYVSRVIADVVRGDLLNPAVEKRSVR
jgi:hypothetical protein